MGNVDQGLSDPAEPLRPQVVQQDRQDEGWKEAEYQAQQADLDGIAEHRQEVGGVEHLHEVAQAHPSAAEYPRGRADSPSAPPRTATASAVLEHHETRQHRQRPWRTAPAAAPFCATAAGVAGLAGVPPRPGSRPVEPKRRGHVRWKGSRRASRWCRSARGCGALRWVASQPCGVPAKRGEHLGPPPARPPWLATSCSSSRSSRPTTFAKLLAIVLHHARVVRRQGFQEVQRGAAQGARGGPAALPAAPAAPPPALPRAGRSPRRRRRRPPGRSSPPAAPRRSPASLEQPRMRLVLMREQ